jgi:hypothetical protein
VIFMVAMVALLTLHQVLLWLARLGKGRGHRASV